jgi:hypothetical protein
MKPGNQLWRLKAIITGSTYWTFGEICAASKVRFQKYDSENGMSARWREVPDHMKHKRIRKGTRNLYEYRIFEVAEAA